MFLLHLGCTTDFSNYTDKLFNEGLNFSLFIDVTDTQLHYLTVWKNKKDWEISFKKAKEYSC